MENDLEIRFLAVSVSWDKPVVTKIAIKVRTISRFLAQYSDDLKLLLRSSSISRNIKCEGLGNGSVMFPHDCKCGANRFRFKNRAYRLDATIFQILMKYWFKLWV